MNDNSILVRNEYEANRVAAKIMLVTIIFNVLVFVLDVMQIFIVPLKTMGIALGIATILLLVPSILIFVLKLDGAWIKYVTITAAALMAGVLNTYLSWHAVLIYIYAIALASLFFSRMLGWFAVLISVIVLSVSQIMSFRINAVTDDNLKNISDVVMFGIMPRAIELLALSMIFVLLSKRTRKMLENVVGAEEQKRMLDRTLSITNKCFEVSNVLADSVHQLSEITEHTSRANEQVAENAGRIAAGSEDTLKFVDEAAETVVHMSNNLNQVAEEGRKIAEISQQVRELTQNNGLIMEEAVSEMRSIADATGGSMQIIHRLEERSSEIGRIVEIIQGISGPSSLCHAR